MHFPILIEMRRPFFLPIFLATLHALSVFAFLIADLPFWAKGLCLLFWLFFLIKTLRLLGVLPKLLAKHAPITYRALYLASPERLELVHTENTPDARLEATCLAYAKLPFCLFLRLRIEAIEPPISLVIGKDQISTDDVRKLSVWCRTQSVKKA